VAAVAGGDAARRVAPARQRLAARQFGGRSVARLRRQVGQVEGGEVPGDLAQVVVGQVLDEIGHRRVVAPPGAEVVELVVEIASGLAGDAREEALRGRAPLQAMAGAAGLHALGDGVGHGDRGRRVRAEGRRRERQRRDGQHAARGPAQSLAHGKPRL
jgi:hypothetical protein